MNCLRLAPLIAGACLCFTLIALPSQAQDKQGNIVEYFGKEKVTEVREGTVIHTFTDGLILGRNRFSMNSGSTPEDSVVASLLLDDGFEIREGDEGGVSRDGEAIKWESIQVDEKNEFSDRRLRSGYLYLEHEVPEAKTVLLDASGHTKMFVNGFPHEGDHYDFGWSLIPIRLQAGKNTFLLTGGRFPRMRARLLAPDAPVQLTPRDRTLPDLLREETVDLLGAIRIVNASDEWFRGTLTCAVAGRRLASDVGPVSPLNSRKVTFTIPSVKSPEAEKVTAGLLLKDESGAVVSELEFDLSVKSKHAHHKRTFLSAMDNSVQYFGVAPCSDPDLENPAMFLSVHGASVEAIGQARAYAPKDWGHLVAPTNRRPFGFAWEDWGRLDALEVLNHAEALFQTDPQRTYLTGHSMGGHGTWYLGATYPDRFAAIGPAAGYPDLLEYRNSFRRRLRTASDEDLKRFGMTRDQVDKMLRQMASSETGRSEMDAMIRRAGNPSRTLKLQRNYLHHGVYVLHGEMDTVVPTFLAREMREVLAKFHPDFSYYEYPGGTHWYGNHSVDWAPLFDFFKFREIKPSHEISRLEFHTASPGVSASSHFASILQQIKPFEISSFRFEREEVPRLTLENTRALAIDLKRMGSPENLKIGEQELEVADRETITLRLEADFWKIVDGIPMNEKGPHRNGGFKDAFRNRMVLVCPTRGTEQEKRWYENRVRHDAETFWYRANGNVEIVEDTAFSADAYEDRNVILYGNAENNAAWAGLLSHCPLQVSKGSIRLGDQTLAGDQYGAYFVYPRIDSTFASVGVVAASGERGMKAAHANWYLLNGTTFPDVMLFDDAVLREGVDGVVVSGCEWVFRQ